MSMRTIANEIRKANKSVGTAEIALSRAREAYVNAQVSHCLSGEVVREHEKDWYPEHDSRDSDNILEGLHKAQRLDDETREREYDASAVLDQARKTLETAESRLEKAWKPLLDFEDVSVSKLNKITEIAKEREKDELKSCPDLDDGFG